MDPERNAKYAIHEACREGRTSVVESLLNANPKLANLKDDDERLPIHWAAAYNHFSIVERLVATRNFDPDIQDGSGWTPLMIASSLPTDDGLQTATLLLSKGAEPNTTSTSGQTALFFAVSKSSLETIKLLLSNGAGVRIKDRRGQYALHRAAAIGSVPIIRLLLGKNSPLNATDVDGLTALHHAISEGHGDAAVELLKAGAEIDKRDLDGKLAIDLAPDGKVRKYIISAAEQEGIDLV